MLTPQNITPVPGAVAMSPQMLLGIHATGMHNILNSPNNQDSRRDLLSMAIEHSVGGLMPGTPPTVGRVSLDGSRNSPARNSPARNMVVPAVSLDTGLTTSEEEHLLDSPQRKA